MGAFWEPGTVEATGASRATGPLEPATTGVSQGPGFSGACTMEKPPTAMGADLVPGWGCSGLCGEVRCSLFSPSPERLSLSALGGQATLLSCYNPSPRNFSLCKGILGRR